MKLSDPDRSRQDHISEAKKARQYFEQAAEDGNIQALVFLAEMCVGNLYEREEMAGSPGILFYLDKAIEMGSIFATFTKAEYLDGAGSRAVEECIFVHECYLGAEYYYRLAGTKGVLGSLYRLGNMYAEGRGVAKDVGAAATLYREMYELIKGNKRAAQVQWKLSALSDDNPLHPVVCFHALMALQFYNGANMDALLTNLLAIENDNFDIFIDLCKNENEHAIKLILHAFSVDFRHKLAWRLNTAISGLSQAATFENCDILRPRLPDELISIVFTYIIGEKLFRLFTSGEILAQETESERLANLTLIKFDKKLSNVPTTQHHGFWRERLTRAKDEIISQTKAVDEIKLNGLSL